MDPQRLPPPRVPSPIREPDSLVVPSTQPRANTTGEDSEAQQPRLQIQIGTTPPRSTSTAPLSPGSVEKHEENDPFETPERQASVHHGTGIDAPLPSARLVGEYQGSRRARTIDTHASMGRRSAIDYIVPTVEEKVCSILVVLFNCVLIDRTYLSQSADSRFVSVYNRRLT
jgi:hypothetical protein